MRWKLLIITSLLAALINAGGMRLLAHWLIVSLKPLSEQPGLLAGLFIIPLIFTTLAGIFVYRHTAGRRKLQASFTLLLTIILTVAVLLIIAQVAPGRTVEGRKLSTASTPSVT